MAAVSKGAETSAMNTRIGDQLDSGEQVCVQAVNVGHGDS